MTEKTPAELHSEIDSQFPTNASGQITAAKLRTVQHDIVDSMTTVESIPPINITGTGDPGLTRAQAIASTFASPPNAIRTTGYDTSGDMACALYVKVVHFRGILGILQTEDGIITNSALENNTVNLAQFGAKPLSCLPCEEPARGSLPGISRC